MENKTDDIIHKTPLKLLTKGSRTKYDRIELYKALLEKSERYNKIKETFKTLSVQEDHNDKNNRSQIGRILKVNKYKSPELPSITGKARFIHPPSLTDERKRVRRYKLSIGFIQHNILETIFILIKVQFQVSPNSNESKRSIENIKRSQEDVLLKKTININGSHEFSINSVGIKANVSIIPITIFLFYYK